MPRQPHTKPPRWHASAPRIAVILDVREAIARQFVQGIIQYSRLHGPWVILASLYPTPESPWNPSVTCDGVIGGFYSLDLLQHFHQRKTPVVNVQSWADPNLVPTVRVDGHAAGRMAFEHLRERGFEHVAFVGVLEGASGLRRQGFIAAAEAAGVKCHEFRTRSGTADWMFAPDELDAFLSTLPKPVGLLAGYEMTGWTVVGKCLDQGLDVPEEVAVLTVGNDDIISEACDIPLSSVTYPGERVGFEAAALLHRLMQGEKLDKALVEIPPTGVITRESTDVLAISDPDVAQAVRFIRERACQGVTVAEVLRAVPVDRRWLERQFRKRLGRSIMGEVYRVRVNRARSLLTGSTLAIPEIAEACGFSQLKSFGSAFHKISGWTPAAYRRTFKHEARPMRMISNATEDPQTAS